MSSKNSKSRNEYYKEYHNKKQETDEYYRLLKKENSKRNYINKNRSKEEQEWIQFLKEQRDHFDNVVTPRLLQGDYYNKVGKYATK